MNRLKSQATGKYICFIGDDDVPEVDYIESFLEAILSDPDIITFDMNYYRDKIFQWKYILGLQMTENQIGNLYFINRIFFPLCPHKKELADQVFFPDLNSQSDVQYSEDLRPFLKTEYRINRVLYHYFFSPVNSEARGAR